MIEAITPLATDTVLSTGEKKVAAPDFGQWIAQQIGDVNQQINNAETSLTELATGGTGNLHHVMLQLEEARTGFQLTLQIRNKVLEGYQEIMRMQI